MKIGSSNASTTAHEVAMPLSQASRTRGEMAMGSETQVRITREEVSFPESAVVPDVRDGLTLSNLIH